MLAPPQSVLLETSSPNTTRAEEQLELKGNFDLVLFILC